MTIEKKISDQIIDPWKVKTVKGKAIDYLKIIEEWGCDPITNELISRWQKLTGQPPHPLIRRGVYYAHR